MLFSLEETISKAGNWLQKYTQVDLGNLLLSSSLAMSNMISCDSFKKGTNDSSIIISLNHLHSRRAHGENIS